MPKKKAWGGKRDGAGRKPKFGVVLKACVMESTKRAIDGLAFKRNRSRGEILDELAAAIKA